MNSGKALKLIAMACLLMASIAPSRSFAQAKSAAPADIAQVTASIPAIDATTVRKRALLKRYLVASHFDDLMVRLYSNFIPNMLEEKRKQQPDLTDDDENLFIEIYVETLKELMPQLINDTTNASANLFSEDELINIVAFYEGRLGQRLVEEIPSIMSNSSDSMSALMPKLEAQFREKYCKKAECEE
jgi:hypothetical protein